MPTCAPTRFGLLFGAYRGTSNGGTCTAPGPGTPEASRASLASVLKHAGYATAAFGKWHLGAHPDPNRSWQEAPAARGFDNWRAWNASNLMSCGSRGYSDWIRTDDGVSVRTKEYHTWAVTNAVLDWWSSVEGPRFAYVAYQAPHSPLHAPPGLPAKYPFPTNARERYEAMLKSLDLALRDLVQGILRRSDRSNRVAPENTYIVFLGDNGTPLGAAKRLENRKRNPRVKKTTFVDGVRVPCIVVGPRVIRGGTTEALGHVVDLFATLVELAGADVPVGAAPDSISLVPCLSHTGARPRSELICDLDQRQHTRQRIWDRCVVAEAGGTLWKLRRFTDLSEPDSSAEDLFALSSDRGERRPLDPQNPDYPTETAQHLRTLLDEYETRSE